MKLTKNFDSSEFKCKCGCECIKYYLPHVEKLQQLRDYFNAPVKITSAYRCPNYNNNVIKSKPTSQHIKGTATDIKIKGISPEEIYEYADKHFDGVGIYDTFIHIDTRGSKARWNNRSKK